MSFRGLYGAVPLTHFLCRRFVRSGDRVIDATCGNGNDTVLLAGLTGEGGRVWAFDVQEAALSRTREALVAAGLEMRVNLVHAGHERLADFVDGQVQAVVFNLGYLPAGDREVRTEPRTTVRALDQAAALLQPGGIILIAVYTGHDNGSEWDEVRQWAADLPPHELNVWQMRQLNRSEAAPFVVLVEKVR